MSRRKRKIVLAPGCAIYLRTSSEDVQAPERSLNAQRRAIYENLIDPNGWEVVEEYADIESGRVTDRENYQRLLADARTGRFSYVCIALVDRFGRDSGEGIRATDELTRLGIRVRVASMPHVDVTVEGGRFMFDVMFSVSRFESHRISTRTKNGMREKYLSGSWPHNAPDGYINKEQPVGELSRGEQHQHARYKRWIEIDPVQAKVWRQAWDLLLTDQMTLRDICEELHARGHRLRTGTPFARTKANGKRIHSSSLLSRTFHNWMYAGWLVVSNDIMEIPPKTVAGDWEPIVSTEVFEAGLVILDRRNRKREPRKKHFYLLQGLVYLQESADNSA